MKLHFAVLLCSLSYAACLFGCGAGNGSSRAAVTIHWGPRSREVDAPSSALSAVILIKDAGGTGKDLSFAANRDAPLGSHYQTFYSPSGVLPGTYVFAVSFYALENGVGDAVGGAVGTLSIDNHGAGSANVETTGAVTSVQIPEGQSVTVGAPSDILVSVLGSDPERYLSVTYGAIFYTVATGQDKLKIENGRLVGLAPGTATVTATVDGISSPAVSVNVVAH